MGQDTKKCDVIGCEKPVKYKGLCKAHYQRMWRTGDAEFDGTTTYTRTRNGKTQTVTRRVRAGETGWARHPLYKRWVSMRYRCHDENAHNYKWYGGRGIVVCDEWRNDFLAFRDWALATGFEPGMEIDRIDNDGPYSPENCQWTTKLDNLARRGAYLPDALHSKLLAEAKRRDISVYALITEAVEAFLIRGPEQEV